MQRLRKFSTVALAAAALAAAGLSQGQTDPQDGGAMHGQKMQRMQNQMQQMQRQMELLGKTHGSEERTKILREHMRTMHEHMQDMQAMGSGQDMEAMMADCMQMMSDKDTDAEPGGEGHSSH